MNTKTTKIEPKPVPAVDINAPLKAVIDESTDYETEVTPRNKFFYIAGIIGLLAIILVTAGLLTFYLTSFKGKGEEKNIEVVEQTVSEEKEIEFNRSAVTFEVLNASGVSGAARSAADVIEKKGYILTETGNAPQTTGNKLYIKKEIEKYSAYIISDLESFKVTAVDGNLTEGNASVRLILGK